MSAATQLPEVGFPASGLHAMRRALEADLGPESAARALQNAGHSAGDAFYALLAGADSVPDLTASEFWRRLGELFAERGWGQLHFGSEHPGIGSLESTDWAEADPATAALRPSCHFTTGLLANLLGRTAGQDVGVLEVECRSRGDLRCRFLFGGADALGHVYAALRAGRDVASAIAELG